MPALPISPAPRPVAGAAPTPFTAADAERALEADIPRYFIDVRVPGYSVEKTLAEARRQQQRQKTERAGPGSTEPDEAVMRKPVARE